MPWVGFESTIPVFERAKTFRALDRAAIVSLATNYKWAVNLIWGWSPEIYYNQNVHGLKSTIGNKSSLTLGFWSFLASSILSKCRFKLSLPIPVAWYGSFVRAVRRRLWLEGTASRSRGWLTKYWLSSHGHPLSTTYHCSGVVFYVHLPR
jgi:hypothetical protein